MFCSQRLCSGVPVVTELAIKELEKYKLTGWLPTFVSDAGSNVRRALAGRVTKDGWREGDNLGDWARCACHMLHNVVMHALGWMERRAVCNKAAAVLFEALDR